MQNNVKFYNDLFDDSPVPHLFSLIINNSLQNNEKLNIELALANNSYVSETSKKHRDELDMINNKVKIQKEFWKHEELEEAIYLLCSLCDFNLDASEVSMLLSCDIDIATNIISKLFETTERPIVL